MERYAEYKDSKIEWVGEIPVLWGVSRLKSVLVDRKEKNNPIKTDFILSLTNTQGVIPYSEKGEKGNKAKEDLTGYFLAHPGDIVLNSMNVVIGSVGLSSYFGAVSPVYYMLRPRDSNDDVRFYNYLFQTPLLQDELRGLGNGILEIRMRIPMSKLNNVIVPLPSSREQCLIANYLDEKTSEIDSLIEETEHAIELLEEYRKSAISETVTKGLNSNVSMKDSGVEWVGEMPAHWELWQAKHLVSINNGSDPHTKGNIPVFGSGKQSFKTCGEFKEPPCVLLGRKGTVNIPQYVNVRYWNVDTAFDVLVQRNDLIDLKYYYYLATCFDYGAYATQTALPSMSQSDYKGMYIPLPPISEQKMIVNYLEKVDAALDVCIAEKSDVKLKLVEYRKSLISEAVTGKFKVPGVI